MLFFPRLPPDSDDVQLVSVTPAAPTAAAPAVVTTVPASANSNSALPPPPQADVYPHSIPLQQHHYHYPIILSSLHQGCQNCTASCCPHCCRCVREREPSLSCHSSKQGQGRGGERMRENEHSGE